MHLSVGAHFTSDKSVILPVNNEAHELCLSRCRQSRKWSIASTSWQNGTLSEAGMTIETAFNKALNLLTCIIIHA